MSSIKDKSKEEPNTAPQTDRWYNLSLGSTFKDHTSTKFCTLRYEFKPASIDKNQPGSLHKNKDRVTVEFQNNQPGKPKLSFEGKGEDYKDSDAVLFFDGQSFRLERLHRAVKQLRHVRLPGESATAAAGASSVGPSMEARSPPLGKGAKSLPPNKALAHSVPVEVERIDVGETEIPGAKPTGRGFDDYHHHASAPPNPSTTISLPDQKSDEMEEEQVDIDIDDIDDSVRTPNRVTNASAATEIGELRTGFDINLPTQNDMDDEIADVDVSDDETAKGPNAAEALRAQVNANTEGGGGGGQTSSSSGSSDSGSSSGSSSSSSSDSAEASDDDSVNSI